MQQSHYMLAIAKLLRACVRVNHNNRFDTILIGVTQLKPVKHNVTSNGDDWRGSRLNTFIILFHWNCRYRLSVWRRCVMPWWKRYAYDINASSARFLIFLSSFVPTRVDYLLIFHTKRFLSVSMTPMPSMLLVFISSLHSHLVQQSKFSLLLYDIFVFKHSHDRDLPRLH